MEMNIVKELEPPPAQGAAGAGKRERSFELTLPALVKGLDARGRRFEERTMACAISAQELSFRLNARLLLGAKMTVALDVPRTLILETPLRLLVTGPVVYVRSETENGKSQYVTVHLDRRFRLQPSPAVAP
ncbi:MAG TPA: hypothetical protein VMS75_03330 [Terriglobales bacterium]|nr:hypothetical protein [Terriglobales bacterium]